MSNRDLPMMPWFPQDFSTATAHWARAERSAYRTLLDYQWMLGGLPTDHDRLAKLCDMTGSEFDEIWPVVREKFSLVGGYLKNKRLEEHRKEALRRKESHSKGAQLANAKRALSGQSASRSADSERTSQRTPLSPSLSEEKKEVLRTSKESAKRLPTEFALTPERISVAQAEKLDPQRTFAQFSDHWAAASGANARKHDWDAAWRNWCRKAADQKGSTNGTHKPKLSAVDRVCAATDKWLEEQLGRANASESRLENDDPNVRNGILERLR